MAKELLGFKKEKKSLENALLQAGLLTLEQLADAQKEQRQTDQSLRAVLVQKGLAGEDAIARALSAHLGIPYIDLEHYYIDTEAVKLL
ncbi:MAG: type II secretion system protein GspE, partial [Planctomycetota bacterium]